MTPTEFVTHLFGEGWHKRQLPLFADMLKRFNEDAQMYYVVRDFAKKLELGDNPVSKEESRIRDDMIDARRYDHDPDEN